MTELSGKTKERISALFPSKQRKEVEDLLIIECGENIPFCESKDKYKMERIRFAALKLSEGSMDKLIIAIELAQKDWRDLLMNAEFGKDLEAHNKWQP